MQTLRGPEGEKEFSKESSRLEKRAREHPETSVRAQSHLQLAFLYVNYRNPQLNYNRALQEMERYFSLTPGKTQSDDVQSWLAVLKEVGKLQKVNKSLNDEVSGLKETIERLKKLDRHIEERRRLTK